MTKFKIKNPNAVVTNKALYEAVDVLVQWTDGLIKEQNTNLNKRFDKIDKNLKEVKTEISWVKDDIKGLTADLPDAVTKTEFNKLQSKVDKYPQTN